MLNMIRTTAASSVSYPYWYCCRSTQRRRGMPFLLHSTAATATTCLDVFLKNLHSQSSRPTKTRNNTQLEQQHLRNPHSRLESNVGHALKVFDEMLQRRPLPSIIRFTRILSQLMKLEHYSKAICLHEQMGRMGIGPDAFTLNITINCYCHLNKMGFALSVFGKFFKFGLHPEVRTFTTLINGFLLRNGVAEATQVFRKMVDTGCKPNLFTFSTLMKGLCSKGNTNGAIQLLRKMELSPDCKPDVVAYSIIIDSLCKETLIADAFNFFSEMISKGITPNVVTYNSLIDGVCRLGQWNQAMRLLNEMTGQKIFPDVRTFNILVDGLCKEGMVLKAKEVIELMIERDIEPNTVTYNSRLWMVTV